MLRWNQLSSLGKNRILKTSYFWLLLVPLAANLFGKIDGLLDVIIFQTHLRLNIGLPFSWKVFYFSSLFVALGDLVFSIHCPRIIIEHRSYAHFQQEGKRWKELEPYFFEVFPHDEFNLPIPQGYIGTENIRKEEDLEADLFWKVRLRAEALRPISRHVCGVSYLIGLLLIALVFFQNFYFVCKLAF